MYEIKVKVKSNCEQLNNEYSISANSITQVMSVSALERIELCCKENDINEANADIETVITRNGEIIVDEECNISVVIDRESSLIKINKVIHNVKIKCNQQIKL